MSRLFIGLISGTSMDGIDAALVELGGQRPELIQTHSHPYAPALADALRGLMTKPQHSLATILRTDVQVGLAFGAAANALLAQAGLKPTQIEAIGSHGQTIYHAPRGEYASTWQLGDPSRIAEATGIQVVADFRRRDMAAGGEGAPLVPAFHQAVFRDARRNRVVLNLGGIANITVLPADTRQPVTGFDTGPGNGLMDAWIAQHLDMPYDRDGEWGASGKVHPGLLERLLNDPYFAQPVPKSTGREYFNLNWLQPMLEAFPHLAERDVQATLCELSARSITEAIQQHAAQTEQVIACGGGVHNRALMGRLEELMTPAQVISSDRSGLDPDWVEAMAFAWLAERTLAGKPGNLPGVTGARAAVVLGGIYPAGVKKN